MSRRYGRVLMVDLDGRVCSDLEIEEAALRQYIGGSGLAAYLYSRLVKGEVPPLDPASPFIVMAGPLTGTPAMLSGRHNVAGRSPLTGFWGEASVGGYWGRELRRAGYDGMVLLGKAAAPVVLSLIDGVPAFHDAAGVWGRDVFETDALLRHEFGDKAQVLSIGPAGERLVKYAGVFTDGVHARVAARCGLGALMGSKNVKAIAVQGSAEVPIRDVEALKASVKELMPTFTGKLKGLSDFGTPGLVCPCEAIGDLPVRNWSLGKWTEGAQKISGQELNSKYLRKRFFCASCPAGCGRTVDSAIEADALAGGPEYETLGMLGSNCLIDDLPAIMRLNELVNRLGMDTIETGAVVALCMELYEEGLIGPRELGAIDPRWGDAQASEALIRMIASRAGFGDVLAEGLQAVVERVGGMAAEYAIHSNNMALPAHDPRAYSSVALGYAAYFAYHYGRMLFGGIQVWYMIVVALPLVVACIGLIGLGFALLMRVRGTGLWGVIAGLVVLGITSLDLVILFVHIVRGTRMIGDPLIGANVMGEAFVQFLFSALFRLAPPAFIVWWSHVLNWEPRW